MTNWFGQDIESPVIVIDTPGIGDSEGKDTEHITDMVSTLKQLRYVHCFLIVINSEDPRFNEQLQNTLKLFGCMLGTDFFKNAIICFSRFRQDKRSIKDIEKGKKASVAQLKEDY